jgi:hypothetical protein
MRLSVRSFSGSFAISVSPRGKAVVAPPSIRFATPLP